MKIVNTLVKLTAAVAAVAGIAYLVVKNIDAITEWLKNLCPCKAEEIFEDAQDAAWEEAPATEEEAVEEASVEEEAEEEAPAEEATPIPEGEPVAEESDFEA